MNLSRRKFLASAGLGPAATALVPRSLWAQGTTPPKRFVAFFSSNGTIIGNNQYDSSGSGTNYQLGSMLDPLTPFKDRLLVLRGLDQKVGQIAPGSAHGRGLGAFLTGRQLLNDGACDPNEPACPGFASGISLDQHLANKLGTTTPFRSLELGVAVDLRANVRGSASFEDRMSYSGPNGPIAPVDDPAAVYKRLFAPLVGGPNNAEILRIRRKSVLDFVNGELSSLNGRLTVNNRAKLDNHLTSLRQIEQQLQAAGPAQQTCSKPGQPATLDPYATNNYPIIAKLQIDMLVGAMACDLTRVGSIMFSGAISNQTFPWLGLTQNSRGHHDLSHDPSTAYPDLGKIKRWHAEQFLYLLQKMDAVKEGNGTLLSNSLVLWGSEIGLGNHDVNDMRFVLAGGANGYFKLGRHLTLRGRHHNDLLVSALQGMGVNENTFGDPGHVSGAITELT